MSDAFERMVAAEIDPNWKDPNADDKFALCDPPEPAVAVADLATPPDRRIRSVVGNYRVVIPDGAQKGRRFFTNNSPVVIEKRSKDATGAEKWDRVMLFPKPGPKSSNEDADHAVYWLLAGPDAE